MQQLHKQSSKPIIELKNVSFTWDKDTKEPIHALKDVSLKIHKGKFISVVGPSGSGKTTLLNMLSGLEQPTTGEIITHHKIQKKDSSKTKLDVGVIFQDYSLFSWLTVEQNVAFSMQMLGYSRAKRNKRTKYILEKVALSKFAHKYPHQLSGGMRQRAAVARALANNVQFLLMDEPFAALDYQTRLMMQNFLLDVWKGFNKTIFFITHQIDEAIQLSDEIYLMSAHPGTITSKIIIKSPRPRDITSKEFNNYKSKIVKHLKKEVPELQNL